MATYPSIDSGSDLAREVAPSPWTTRKVSEVGRVQLGRQRTPKYQTGLHSHKYLRVANVYENRLDLSDVFSMDFNPKDFEAYHLHSGDILLNEGQSTELVGRPAMWQGELPDCCFQNTLVRFQANPAMVDSRFALWVFLFYFRTGEFSKISSKTSNVAHLGAARFANMPFPVPPLEEQRRIAAILDQADALRDKRRQALALVEQLTQSIFIEMFGEQGGLWAQISVADCLAPKKDAIRTGPFGSQLLTSEFVDQGIPVLGIDNVVSNSLSTGQPRFITQKKFEELKRYQVFPGDVLITIMGTCGRCAIVPGDIGIAVNTKHICCLTLDSALCDPVFFQSCFLHSPLVLKALGYEARGAVMPGLNMGIIKQLKIPLPPLELQQEFARRVEAVEKLKAAHQRSLEEMDALFASLQHRAFRGEL